MFRPLKGARPRGQAEVHGPRQHLGKAQTVARAALSHCDWRPQEVRTRTEGRPRGDTRRSHGMETLSTRPGERPGGNRPPTPGAWTPASRPGTGSVCGLRCHLWSFVMWPQDTHK